MMMAMLCLGFVLYPVGARAAGSLVTLVDATSSNKAKVDTTGALKVGDGTGPLTVDGTVGSRLSLPTNPWHYEVSIPDSGNVLLFVPPAGRTKLAITSLTYTGDNADTNDVVNGFVIVRNNNCGAAQVEVVHRVTTPALGSIHADFPSPLVIDVSGTRVVCFASTSPMTVSAVGFYQ